MRAIDISNYTGYLSAETLQAWKDAGIVTVIVRASTESQEKRSIARQQLKACYAAGFTIQAYMWLYFDGSNPIQQMLDALNVCAGYPVHLMWIDCEDTCDLTTEDVIATIQQAVDASTITVGVYTGGWWWKDKTGNTDTFSYLPLLDADYDDNQSLGNFSQYGGWTHRSKQYAGNVNLGGVTVDLVTLEVSSE